MRWFSFSLRRLLLVVGLFALAAGLWKSREQWEVRRTIMIENLSQTNQVRIKHHEPFGWRRFMFPHLSHVCDEVEVVMFSHQPVSSVDLRKLKALGPIATVYMERVTISDYSLREFADLRNVSRLELDSVSDLMDSPLTALARADSLKELRLEDIFPSKDCLIALCDMKGLRVLRLDNTSIDTIAVAEFKRVRPDVQVVIETWRLQPK